jgi:hypothetical protein
MRRPLSSSAEVKLRKSCGEKDKRAKKMKALFGDIAFGSEMWRV